MKSIVNVSAIGFILQEGDAATSFGQQIPSDRLLDRISKEAAKRDWHLLANKLGFTAANIRTFEKKNSTDKTQQVI